MRAASAASRECAPRSQPTPGAVATLPQKVPDCCAIPPLAATLARSESTWTWTVSVALLCCCSCVWLASVGAASAAVGAAGFRAAAVPCSCSSDRPLFSSDRPLSSESEASSTGKTALALGRVTPRCEAASSSSRCSCANVGRRAGSWRQHRLASSAIASRGSLTNEGDCFPGELKRKRPLPLAATLCSCLGSSGRSCLKTMRLIR